LNPRWGYKPHTPLAGERLRPLGHLTVLVAHILPAAENMSNSFSEKGSVRTVLKQTVEVMRF
ncbi:hypothetical protein Q4519_21345, partial [Motilimonas sp. 1_MG-2023]|uniref:hypothetical protein n=1 Tax=Motilimonas sp. 1_MG-2023 TaxID=3062672 RepID=UPI0026E1CD62